MFARQDGGKVVKLSKNSAILPLSCACDVYGGGSSPCLFPCSGNKAKDVKAHNLDKLTKRSARTSVLLPSLACRHACVSLSDWMFHAHFQKSCFTPMPKEKLIETKEQFKEINFKFTKNIGNSRIKKRVP